jgi:hypothetical protein
MFEPSAPDAPDPAVLEPIERARAAASDGAPGTQGPFAAAVRDKVDRALAVVLSETVTTTAVRTVALPAALPDAPREVRARYYLPCNLAPSSPGELTHELWDALEGAFR